MGEEGVEVQYHSFLNSALDGDKHHIHDNVQFWVEVEQVCKHTLNLI